eukprot:scaffold37702_cov155-Skeletonema_marinoi.AAC.3
MDRFSGRAFAVAAVRFVFALRKIAACSIAAALPGVRRRPHRRVGRGLACLVAPIHSANSNPTRRCGLAE